MLKLSDKMRTRLVSLRRPNNEDGVALIAVILVMMLLLMTTILITLTVMTTQSQTKEFNIHQQARSTADSGLSSFLSAVNTSTGSTMLETYKTSSTTGAAQKTTPSNALCKTLETTVSTQVGYYPRWCAWTVKVSSGTGTTGYYIYSKGFTVPTQSSSLRSNAADEVVIRVFVEPLVVDSTTALDDGKVVYRMPADAPFQLGLTGQESITVQNGAAIYANQFSRNSAPSGTNTAFVALASDELISLPSNFVTGTLTAPANKTVADICTPVGDSACTSPVQRLSPVSADMNAITDYVNAACPNAANTYPSWTASANGTATIPAGCYNNVVLDRDMIISAAYTADMPLEINVKGTVSIRSNADIGLNRDPAAFQIRSIGSVAWSNGSGATVNLDLNKHTNAYVASSAACTTNANTTRKLYVNGALACGTVNIGPNTIVYMDTKSQQYGIEVINQAPVNSIWFATGIEQL